MLRLDRLQHQFAGRAADADAIHRYRWTRLCNREGLSAASRT
jgi:hypothetical protein